LRELKGGRHANQLPRCHTLQKKKALEEISPSALAFDCIEFMLVKIICQGGKLNFFLENPHILINEAITTKSPI